jgi:hypothetical protein
MGKGDTLPLVKSVAEIQRNAATLGAYLQNTNSLEREYAKERIGKGRCFVIVSSPHGYCSYPSRFMGYVDNSMEAHERMGEIKKKTWKTTRDGKKMKNVCSSVSKRGVCMKNKDVFVLGVLWLFCFMLAGCASSHQAPH